MGAKRECRFVSRLAHISRYIYIYIYGLSVEFIFVTTFGDSIDKNILL